jgi:hypothetical protein
MKNDVKSDATIERELEQMRALLIHDEQLPLGLVSRLEVGVRRNQTASQPLGWGVRLGVACVCFVVFGLWSRAGMSASLAGVLALIALIYPFVCSETAGYS